MTYTTKAIGWMAIVVGIGLLWLGCESVSSEQARGKSSYSWQQTDGSIALLNSKRTVWQFNYRKQEGWPYFPRSPLITLSASSGCVPLAPVLW